MHQMGGRYMRPSLFVHDPSATVVPRRTGSMAGYSALGTPPSFTEHSCSLREMRGPAYACVGSRSDAERAHQTVLRKPDRVDANSLRISRLGTLDALAEAGHGTFRRDRSHGPGVGTVGRPSIDPNNLPVSRTVLRCSPRRRSERRLRLHFVKQF